MFLIEEKKWQEEGKNTIDNVNTVTISHLKLMDNFLEEDWKKVKNLECDAIPILCVDIFKIVG